MHVNYENKFWICAESMLRSSSHHYQLQQSVKNGLDLCLLCFSKVVTHQNVIQTTCQVMYDCKLVMMMMMSGPVHTTPEKFENASCYFYTISSTVHTSPSRKQSFSKTIFKQKEFENTGVWFSCGRKRFWKRRRNKGRRTFTWILLSLSSNRLPVQFPGRSPASKWSPNRELPISFSLLLFYELERIVKVHLTP